jgi:hypothetical protein
MTLTIFTLLLFYRSVATYKKLYGLYLVKLIKKIYINSKS